MNGFVERLNKTKTVSLWGIGYLGYTTILRLQTNGFKIICSTLDKDVKNEIENGTYPCQYMKEQWSIHGDVPGIDYSKVIFSDSFDSMFDTNVHIIAVPAYNDSGSPETYNKLVDIFRNYSNLLADNLILFQSAERVGTVDTFFIEPLKKTGAKCYFASAFRSDWTIEEFSAGNDARLLSANDEESLNVAKKFFNMLNVSYSSIVGIKEAELCENAKNCLEYTIEAFFAQLSFAYPAIDINEVSKMVLGNYNYSCKQLGLNLLNHKKLLHIDHVLAGQNGDYLSIIKEMRSINMTNVMLYAEILKKNSIKSVTIMGLSVDNAIKDIRASSSVILAEYLNNLGIDVCVHDPYYSSEEVKQILPFAKVGEFKRSNVTDGFIIMNSNVVYKSFTQQDIERMGIFSARIIIDSTGQFQYFNYSDETVYHLVGDGNLKVLL